MPRFQVYVYSRGVGSAHGYISQAGHEIATDARASDARTFRGPEGTIASEFIVSAADVDEAEAIGHEVFRAGLLKADAPADTPDWRIIVGARLIDEATGRPVQPAASVTVVLGSDVRIIVTWDDLQALQRRLEHIQEAAGLRDNLWEPLGEERVVIIAGRQAVALLHALEDWSVDANADEAIPQGLVILRDALVDDLGERS
jgi:hypothetical protein